MKYILPETLQAKIRAIITQFGGVDQKKWFVWIKDKQVSFFIASGSYILNLKLKSLVSFHLISFPL